MYICVLLGRNIDDRLIKRVDRNVKQGQRRINARSIKSSKCS